jgi:hypothetical protein
MLAKYPVILGDPELRLARADRRVTDAKLTQGLRLSAGPNRYLKERTNKDDELGFHRYVSCPYVNA